MPRGGARVRSGPPADPNALRREKDHMEFTELPAAGRGKPAPRWPLSPAANTRERYHWRNLWRRREATQWEVLGLEVEVAVHVRTTVAIEAPGPTSSLLAEWRRQRDALGLTTAGRKSLRWIVETNATPSPAQPKKQATGTDGAAAPRWRPEVIDGGS